MKRKEKGSSNMGLERGEEEELGGGRHRGGEQEAPPRRSRKPTISLALLKKIATPSEEKKGPCTLSVTKKKKEGMATLT